MLIVFNAHMHDAMLELAYAKTARSLTTIRNRYAVATWHVQEALAEANRMRDRKRAGLCLKALHWIRLAIAA